MELLEEDDFDEIDDRCPLSFQASRLLGGPHKSTALLKSLIQKNKVTQNLDEETPTNFGGNLINLKRLDSTSSAPASSYLPSFQEPRTLHRDTRTRRTSLVTLPPPPAEFRAKHRAKRSQSVPLVDTHLQDLSFMTGQRRTSQFATDTGHVYENKLSSEDFCDIHDSRQEDVVGRQQENEAERGKCRQLRSQDSTTQTEVFIPLDSMLFAFDVPTPPPEDESTQTSSEPQVSIDTSTSSIRKYDKVPFYQRKLIGWGTSEIFAANLCHPYQAFRRYPGFTREELLALQCVLYIWGVLLVVTSISLYLVI